MNKHKAKLLKISIAVLVIFTLVTVLVVYAANVNGMVDGPNEWEQGAWHTDTIGDVPPPDLDITNIYGEYGPAEAWFRIDTWAPPPFAGGAPFTAEIYIVILNTVGPWPPVCPDPTPVGAFPGAYNYYIHATNNTGNGNFWTTNVFECGFAGWQPAPQNGPRNTVSMMIVETEVPLLDIGFFAPPLPGEMNFFVYYEVNVGGPPIDFDHAPNPSLGLWTLVDLASFSATAGEDGVQVAWETASEVDNAGFNVYRADSADGEYVKLNDGLIPAQGGPTQGASYSFLDAGASGGYYKLEDVDTSGVSTLHGPVSADGGDPNVVRLQALTASASSIWLLPMLVLGAGGLALLWRKRRP